MPNRINHKPIRYQLKMKLTFPWGISVGSDIESLNTDKPILLGSNGRPLVPATSIAGVIRGFFEKSLGTEFTKRYFGYIPAQGANNNDFGLPSRLRFHDVIINEGDCHIRDGVGINRSTGAAQDRVKFDREFSSLDCTGNLVVDLDGDDDSANNDKSVLLMIKRILSSGVCRIGGGRDSGITEGSNSTIGSYDLRKPRELVSYLNGTECTLIPDSVITDLPFISNANLFWLKMKISLSFNSPLLSNSDQTFIGEDALLESDHHPLCIRGTDSKPQFIIPGTSIRGSFRQGAERILGIRDKTHCDPFDKDAMDHQENCQICSLFGMHTNAIVKHTKPKDPNGKKREIYQAGRIHIGPARYSSAEQSEVALKKLDMVAINRFSGGAADRHKFDAVVLTKGKLNFDIIVRNPVKTDFELLFHLLSDLRDGLLRIGYGTRKGWGLSKLESVHCELFDLASDFKPVEIKGDDLLAGLKELALKQTEDLQCLTTN